MKQFLSLLLFLLSFNLYAAKAIVVVLEAPLLLSPDMKSQVLQTTRKGDLIYIHGQGVDTSPYEVEYNVDSEGNPLTNYEEIRALGFYKTLTRDGKDAYVPTRYVKVLFNDTRELMEGTKSFSHDPTDYRIEEPLPKGYPLFIENHKKALAMGGIGPGRKSGYSYPDKIKAENVSSRYGASFIYANAVNFDTSDRFYFGAMFQIFSQSKEFLTESDRLSNESHTELGAGPYISYDFYRTSKHRLTLGGGLTVNYHRYLIEQKEDSGGFEQRIFNGFSFSSKIATYFTFRNFIPKTDLDFVIGLESEFNLPYSLTTSTGIENSEYWSEESDEVSFGLAGQYALYFGIQSNY